LAGNRAQVKRLEELAMVKLTAEECNAILEAAA
jgi:hypothetical protein